MKTTKSLRIDQRRYQRGRTGCARRSFCGDEVRKQARNHFPGHYDEGHCNENARHQPVLPIKQSKPGLVTLTTNGTSLKPGYCLFLTYTLLALLLSGFLDRTSRNL